MIKSCQECSTTYDTPYSNKRYCSDICKINSRLKICHCCNNTFERKHGTIGKYCSSSCAAKINNRIPKRKLTNTCKCGEVIYSNVKYCSNCVVAIRQTHSKSQTASLNSNGLTKHANKIKSSKQCDCGNMMSRNAKHCLNCYANVRRFEKVQSWLSGEWRGGSDISLSDTIRNYLLDMADFKCSKCSFSGFHPDDNKTILEINHIDGNGLNHSPDNLEVLCPNCHAMTSSYRGRNIGSGRPMIYIRKSQ